MKQWLVFASLFFCVVCVGFAQCVVVPAPAHFKQGEGAFVFGEKTKLVCDKSLTATATLFAETIAETIGRTIPVVAKGRLSGNIKLTLAPTISSLEGYSLSVTSDCIEIVASTKAGIFYALQSLRQIVDTERGKTVPAQEIADQPRFAWRGVMLDVSRTFMNVTFVKRYIDLCALYKLNVIHMHLTDDQGWRVEIKRYPQLTEIGSKFDSDFNRMGGYYTQDDIRELVRYAELRNVTLVPEIEMPGHVCALIAAYPELSCSKLAPKIHTFLEGPSVHTEILCAGKGETYDFLFGVLDEIMELFPSRYIHIGGDEAPKEAWKECSDCQKAIKENNLHDEEQLQSLFVKRIGNYLSQQGRTLIGWDEIMDGGMLNGDEVLMYWRGWMDAKIREQIGNSFKVVCSPTSHCYFDYDYKTIDTRRIYDYDPVHQGALDANYLGVQANFWSHIDRSEHNIDKQLFPRLLGLAETAWSLPENKNWERFRKNANRNVHWLRSRFVNVYDDNCLKEE